MPWDIFLTWVAQFLIVVLVIGIIIGVIHDLKKKDD